MAFRGLVRGVIANRGEGSAKCAVIGVSKVNESLSEVLCLVIEGIGAMALERRRSGTEVLLICLPSPGGPGMSEPELSTPGGRVPQQKALLLELMIEVIPISCLSRSSKFPYEIIMKISTLFFHIYQPSVRYLVPTLVEIWTLYVNTYIPSLIEQMTVCDL